MQDRKQQEIRKTKRVKKKCHKPIEHTSFNKPNVQNLERRQINIKKCPKEKVTNKNKTLKHYDTHGERASNLRTKKGKRKKVRTKIIKEELAVLVGFKITLKRNNAENRQSRPLMIG